MRLSPNATCILDKERAILAEVRKVTPQKAGFRSITIHRFLFGSCNHVVGGIDANRLGAKVL